MKTVLVVRACIVVGVKTLVDLREDGHRLFGGRVKARETVREALARELAEELDGASFDIGQLIAMNERQKDKKRIVEFVFMAHPVGEGLIELTSAEHNPQWIDLAESGVRFGAMFA